jgi:hypothetical protein
MQRLSRKGNYFRPLVVARWGMLSILPPGVGPVIKSKNEYHNAVKAALRAAGLPASFESEAPEYESYLACADLIGDGEVVAERSSEGRVRILVSAPNQDDRHRIAP